MSYCLLLQGADGGLRLLADAPFVSRNEALAALASKAESGLVDSAVDHVWLIDMDSVAPVVLVGRSAAADLPATDLAASDVDSAVTAESVVTQSPAVSPVQPAWAAAAGLVPDVPVADVTATEVSEADVTELAVAGEEAAISEPAEDVAPEPSPDLPEPGAVFEPDEAFAPATEVDEPEDATGTADAESILDDLVLPEPDLGPQPIEEDSFSDLREALERSAAQMAAEGVAVPPAAPVSDVLVPAELPDSLDIECATVEESVEAATATSWQLPDDGPELVSEDAQSEERSPETDEFAGAEAADLNEAPDVSGEVAGHEVGAVEEPAAEDADSEAAASSRPAEAAGWPWADSLPVIDADDVPSASVVAGYADAATPVDEAEADLIAEDRLETVAPSSPEVTDATPSEPMSVFGASEDGTAFVGAGEELAYASHQPIESVAAEEVVTPVSDEGTASGAPTLPDEVVGVSEPESAGPEVTVPVDADLVPEPSAFESDVVAPTTTERPGYTPAFHGVADMTCGDCVWVDTCPNKDQRDPASCGSFQWK